MRDIINRLSGIAEFYTSPEHIFRGEAECHREISSGLHRQLYEIKHQNFDIMEAQKRQLEVARQYTKDADDFAILSQIQHRGGKTNLIDFTTDLNIALFFACYYSPDKDGRVIFLPLPYPGDGADYAVRHAIQPSNMADAQKSIFVIPNKGYIREEDTIIVEIPHHLKAGIVEHLRKVYGIEAATVYNDISGFIRGQEEFKDYEAEFYAGAKYDSDGDLEKAIEHYTIYLEHPETLWRRGSTHLLRGIAYLKSGLMDKAIEDFRSYESRHWTGKPELPLQLRSLIENAQRIEEANQNAERESQSNIPKEPALISRFLFKAFDESGKAVSDGSFLYMAESGYSYHQRIPQSDNGMIVTVPSHIYTHRDEIRSWFWFRKAGYRSINGVEFRWKSPFTATLLPHEGNEGMPKITVKVETQITQVEG